MNGLTHSWMKRSFPRHAALFGVVMASALAFATTPARDSRFQTEGEAKIANTETKKRQSSTQTPQNQLPSKLPKFNPKNRLKIDFEQDSGDHVTSVIVRTPLPLSQALQEKSKAEQDVTQSLSQSNDESFSKHPTVEIKAKPVVPMSLNDESVDLVDATEKTLDSRQDSENKKAHANETNQAANLPTKAAPSPLVAPPSSTISANPSMSLNTAAPPTSSPNTPTLSINTIVPAPIVERKDPRPALHLITRVSYVSAQFQQISPELMNGLTNLALGISRIKDHQTLRGSVEIGHGLDQAVTAHNIRHFVVRGDWIETWGAVRVLDQPISPILGLGLGFADISVRSHRLISSGDIVEREHARAQTLFVAPGAGLRIANKEFTFDMTVEYFGLASGSSSALGGLTGAFTLGIPFF